MICHVYMRNDVLCYNIAYYSLLCNAMRSYAVPYYAPQRAAAAWLARPPAALMITIGCNN